MEEIINKIRKWLSSGNRHVDYWCAGDFITVEPDGEVKWWRGFQRREFVDTFQNRRSKVDAMDTKVFKITNNAYDFSKKQSKRKDLRFK